MKYCEKRQSELKQLNNIVKPHKTLSKGRRASKNFNRL